jgi:hypothetical protein
MKQLSAGFMRVARNAVGLALFGLSACGSGSGSSSSGRLTVGLTDAPVDGATSVVVAFTGIDLHGADGTTTSVNFAATQHIDLLKLQGGATGILTQGTAVPAGDYQWLRLKVLADKDTQNESYITLSNGSQYPLYIPSGAETGLKLVSGFTVAQGGTTSLLVEFDLRKSVTAPQGQGPDYILKPALRVINELQVGKIAATVDLAGLTAAQLGSGARVPSCSAGLYVFSGATATPDDTDGDTVDDGGTDPVAYLPIPNDGTTTMASLTIPFIATGSYTVAATCNFNIDGAPDINDYIPNAAAGQAGYQAMKWSTVDNVTVSAGSTTTVSLP